MPEGMNLSINGQSQVPPGFRFHPTEEELLHYYLRKKVGYENIDLDVIREVDLNKLEPWDIQEKCKIGSTPQNDWYFFSHKDKKYPTGTRTNRATTAGFWKATGRDKIIYSSFKRIGLRKTLVFYKGRAPHGQKSDWIMHEYRLDDNTLNTTICPSSNSNPITESLSEDGWVVCRVFRKKNYQKVVESPKSCSIYSIDTSKPSAHMISSNNNGVLDQILLYMGRNGNSISTCKMESIDESLSNMNGMRMVGNGYTNMGEGFEFMHLPKLDSPPMMMNNNSTNLFQSMDEMLTNTQTSYEDNKSSSGLIVNDWVALERLVASQLNGHDQLLQSSFGNIMCPDGNGNEDEEEDHNLVYNSNQSSDLWSSFTDASSDPLCHLSV